MRLLANMLILACLLMGAASLDNTWAAEHEKNHLSRNAGEDRITLKDGTVLVRTVRSNGTIIETRSFDGDKMDTLKITKVVRVTPKKGDRILLVTYPDGHTYAIKEKKNSKNVFEKFADETGEFFVSFGKDSGKMIWDGTKEVGDKFEDFGDDVASIFVVHDHVDADIDDQAVIRTTTVRVYPNDLDIVSSLDLNRSDLILTPAESHDFFLRGANAMQVDTSEIDVEAAQVSDLQFESRENWIDRNLALSPAEARDFFLRGANAMQVDVTIIDRDETQLADTSNDEFDINQENELDRADIDDPADIRDTSMETADTEATDTEITDSEFNDREAWISKNLSLTPEESRAFFLKGANAMDVDVASIYESDVESDLDQPDFQSAEEDQPTQLPKSTTKVKRTRLAKD